LVDENKIEKHQQRVERDLTSNRSQKLFTIFSIINSEGDILADGKYGLVTREMREQYEIPSLKTRDYVQQIFHDRATKFICGTPVIGSTSKEFMIPVGIKLNEDSCLTFGMSVVELMKILPRQASHEIIL
jgi:hypothetical protein